MIICLRWLTPAAVMAAWSVGGVAPRAAGGAEPPRAVAVWPADLMEVRVAFDRPVAAAITKVLPGRIIRLDEAASRREAAKSPARLTDGPAIAACRVEGGGRLLVVTTDPHSRAAVYYLPLPTLDASGEPTGTVRDMPYDLSGVEATWDPTGAAGEKPWTGWWPDLSTASLRALAGGSVAHSRGLAALSKTGRLTLRTLVQLPRGQTKLRVHADQPIAEALFGGENGEPRGDAGKGSTVEFPVEGTGDPIDLSLIVETGASNRPVGVTAMYGADSAPGGAIGRDRLWVPWAPPAPAPVPSAPAPAGLTGGDSKRGEAVFFGEAAKCAHCHRIGGKGGNVGPDLTSVFERPAAEVYRDVAEPSTVIRLAFVPYTVALKDGRVLAGIVRAEGTGAVRLTDTEAKTTVIPRAEIEALRPSATSVMPVGLVGAIGEANMRDLMAFLMQPKK
jgi:putative heme-binding domain-containing protein